MQASALKVEDWMLLLKSQDNLVVIIAQHALEGALSGLLHYLLDVIVFGSFLKAAGQIHN